MVFTPLNLFYSSQVLCPRCEVGNVGSPKRKAKKGKESPKSNKKKTQRLNTLSDVEKALSDTKDSTSAVSAPHKDTEADDGIIETLIIRCSDSVYVSSTRWQLWRSCG